jgi:hypothetical protein
MAELCRQRHPWDAPEALIFKFTGTDVFVCPRLELGCVVTEPCVYIRGVHKKTEDRVASTRACSPGRLCRGVDNKQRVGRTGGRSWPRLGYPPPSRGWFPTDSPAELAA